jgi:hypothetical protein
VLRSATDDQEPRWCPMTKGVANFWRYAEVAANGRLLTALARVPLTGAASAELDALCLPVTAADRHVAAFNAIHPDTAELFAAVLTSPSTDSATGICRANSTLPRCRGNQAPSHLTPDRQAPRPHHPGQEQPALSPHRPRSQGHVACRSLPSYRLSQRLPGSPSRMKLPRSCQFLGRNCINGLTVVANHTA